MSSIIRFGSQYTSVAFGNRCKEAGVRPSTGLVGDAYDDAMCESFFATLECELINRRRFRCHNEARMAVLWPNQARLSINTSIKAGQLHLRRSSSLFARATSSL